MVTAHTMTYCCRRPMRAMARQSSQSVVGRRSLGEPRVARAAREQARMARPVPSRIQALSTLRTITLVRTMPRADMQQAASARLYPATS